MFTDESIFFISFTLFIITVLLLDLGIFSKKDHTVTFGEAAAWSAVWVMFALGFYVFIDNYGHLIHGIDSPEKLAEITNYYSPDFLLDPDNHALNLDNYRHRISMEFITGYLLEYSLSADNIFVILLIFTTFGVSEKYYKKVLFWGILGAIILRFLFIFLGSVLITHFHFVLYGFGIFLIYTGIKMIFDDEDEKIDPERHPIVRFASKYFSVFPRFVKEHFFIRKNGVLMMTPLFVVLIIIEFTDLIFAVDSVPAIFSVTKDPYIVFFSNIFAILGLRSMFFFLSNIMHYFRFLKTGLSFLLVFIGIKMLLADKLKAIGFETEHSLYVILAILGASIGASMLFPKKEDISTEEIEEE